VKRHAKAPTAASTQRQAKSLGRTWFAPTAVLAVAIASLLAFAATPASASLLRNHEGSFGSFGSENPQVLAVDQSNGDVYAIDTATDKVLRFNSAGLPHDFSAGPDAGTNELSGLSFDNFPSINEIAVDNSGGPSDGNVYVTQRNSGEVKVFAPSGQPLGTLTGTGTPAGSFGEACGVAVDQSNGDVYVATSFQSHVWRYSPSGSTVTEGNYSGGIEVGFVPCQLAAASGSVYVHGYQEEGPGPLRKFASSEFALSPPSASGTLIASKANAVATDPSNGDVYVDEGKQISVLGSDGSSKYSFGSGEVGNFSAGVGVRAGGKAYVANSTAHEIEVYGTALEPGTRANLFSFGSFSSEDPQALAVDQSNGDVYAIDTSHDKVLRFNSAGLPHDFSAGPDAGTNELSGLSFDNFPSINEIAVDNSGGPSDGNVYVTQRNSGEVKVFAPSGQPLGTLTGTGTPAGSFGEACGVAVDQSNGDVYVATSFQSHVWRYSPSGSTVTEGNYSGGIEVGFVPCQLAAASGSVYVHGYVEENPGPLHEFATSEFALSPPSASGTLVGPKANAVATDPSNGDVYVDEGKQISVFGSTGAVKYSFGSGEVGNFSAGVAVEAGGNIYVSDSTNHRIVVYGPFSAPPPLVSTKPATGVKHVKATLHGHLDPNNSLPITGCEFEWGESTSYGETPIPCAEGTSFNAAADVSAELGGLALGSTYHFRLHVITGGGGFSGEDKSFETPPSSSVPEVVTGKGSIVSSTSSQLNGTVDPNAIPLTNCHFEYVTDLAFQATGFSDLSSGGAIPCDQSLGSIPADFEDHEVTATATGLDPEQIYRFRLVAENANGTGSGKDALVPGSPLVETTGSTYRTTTTARLDSRVSPHGAATDYWFEYVADAQFQASGFTDATSTPDTPLAVNEVQEVRTDRGNNPEPQFSLSFEGETTPYLSIEATGEQVQAALRALPSIGSSNVDVAFTRFVGSRSYTITFVGALANTDVGQISVSPGPVAPGHLEAQTLLNGGPAGATSFVSAGLSGLQPNTAYRYRVVADNGTPGGPSVGDSATLTTRASEAPLGHGHFPGPPGSDRAWEQVNAPDTGGNPVGSIAAVSANGDRAVYGIRGGSPGSQTGSIFNLLFAERTPSGWKSSTSFYPTREQAPGNFWFTGYGGPSDLSQEFALNIDSISGGTADIWRLSPDALPQRLASVPHEQSVVPLFLVSDDGSRVIWQLEGSVEPSHPVAQPFYKNLYDVSSGTPHLISLLPDGSLPECGVAEHPFSSLQHWLSADGTRLFFEVRCTSQSLYVRDLETETTSLIASGEHIHLIRSTADAAFFITEGSLVPEDEGGKDVYRYDLEDESLDCLTCFGGLTTDVEEFENPFRDVGISEDGSRLYFKSPHRLLPGAAGGGIYRLDVASGDLAYVAPGDGRTNAGALAAFGNAISPDGSVFVFYSDSPALDFLNGPRNGGTGQYYRYDDNDRSLVCVSCPADGSPPRGVAPLLNIGDRSPLSSDGDDFVFSTPTPLVSADQNTAGPGQNPAVGQDVYEWRGGRLLLVTDGLTSSDANSGEGPQVAGITPSGRDIFFNQDAQLTPDAIDTYRRLYDARIGGGFAFPPPPPPCPLEACQGTPRGVPEESRPGSADFAGAGNAASHPARCRKGKVRRSGRCVAKKHKRQRAKKRSQHRANHDRRASR
jgi:NHL repeat